MYHHLRGKLVNTGPMLAVVEAGGMGYELHVPLSTLEALQGLDEVLLYTHLHVREDDLRLFGFATRAERELFRLILSVSGVGPALALAALSALSPEELANALASGDTASIRRIKGVGKRLAERLVVELKDRVATMIRLDEGRVTAHAARKLSGRPCGAGADSRIADAIAALVSLGFQRNDAEERVGASLKRLAENGSNDGEPTVEQLIRESLR